MSFEKHLFWWFQNHINVTWLSKVKLLLKIIKIKIFNILFHSHLGNAFCFENAQREKQNFLENFQIVEEIPRIDLKEVVRILEILQIPFKWKRAFQWLAHFAFKCFPILILFKTKVVECINLLLQTPFIFWQGLVTEKTKCPIITNFRNFPKRKTKKSYYWKLSPNELKLIPILPYVK